MDISALDKALQQIAIKRTELAKVDYNNPKYDDLEEELHDLEDAFQVTYGDYLEEVLQDVHDKYCPESEVLYPVAYLAKSYQINGNEFKVAPSDGVFVEVEKFNGKDTKLVIVPAPVRILLNIGKDKQEVVWQAK
ncbi:MAG: hypothetical protein MUC38_12005 [Cyclobacteriaceae bacterium]|jgi:hypothetical protein|nr:hypothetical protein [Cyclobacteriaceae bacterium]